MSILIRCFILADDDSDTEDENVEEIPAPKKDASSSGAEHEVKNV